MAIATAWPPVQAVMDGISLTNLFLLLLYEPLFITIMEYMICG